MIILLLGFDGNAQVKTKIFYNPVPLKYKLLIEKVSNVYEISPPNLFLELAAKNDSIETTKFALPVKANINFLQEASMLTEGETTIYSLAIKANGAMNLSLQFTEFNLPENALLSIYSKNEFTDSITSQQNNESNIWATRVYQGDMLTISVKIPNSLKWLPKFNISTLNFGYKRFGVQADFGNPGTSAPCHINANCPAGNAWGNEKNAVAMIVVNGTEQCTGALIMSVGCSNTPYFLTANHCLGAGNVPNWVFQFQTLSSDCATNTGWREDVQFNGCVLRANNASTDFALLELNTIPPANSDLFYAGWSRQTTGIATTTVLHHPLGDLMKISVDNQGPFALNTFGVDAWQINQDLGRLEPGSSGAPYFNQNHQIIGQHWRRPAAGTGVPVCDITIAEGGRFDRSWTGGGTNATRLSNWLDPNNTGVLTTNTTSISNLISVRAEDYPISGPPQFCTSGEYRILNLPVGATVRWIVTPISGLPSQSVVNNILTLTRISDGNATVSAKINICGSDILIPPIAVKIGGEVITVTSTQTSCEGVQYNVIGTVAPGANYNWSSNGNSILYNGTSTTATTSVGQIDATISGNDIAIVNTINTCGQSVNAGGHYNPYQREIIGIYPEYTNGDHVSVSVNTTVYDTYYRWYINNTLVKEGSSATSYCTCNYETPDARVCGENTIRVEVETSCSINASYEVGFFKICNNYKSEPNVEIFPNPARDQITVRLKPISSKQVTGNLKEIRELKIIDKLGRVKKVIKYPAKMKTIIVDVSSLQLDIYYIEVFDGTNYARLPLSILK